MRRIIGKLVQKKLFKDVLSDFRNAQNLTLKSVHAKFSPFPDSNGLIRLRGHLKNINLSFQTGQLLFSSFVKTMNEISMKEQNTFEAFCNNGTGLVV